MMKQIKKYSLSILLGILFIIAVTILSYSVDMYYSFGNIFHTSILTGVLLICALYIMHIIKDFNVDLKKIYTKISSVHQYEANRELAQIYLHMP